MNGKLNTDGGGLEMTLFEDGICSFAGIRGKWRVDSANSQIWLEIPENDCQTSMVGLHIQKVKDGSIVATLGYSGFKYVMKRVHRIGLPEGTVPGAGK